MIFSSSTAEMYWIFSMLLPNYDISIIKKIIELKKQLDHEENILWHSKQGIALKRLKLCDDNYIIRCKEILFSPMQPELKIFHLKIIIETFGFPGFILQQVSENEYIVPKIRELCETLNHYINKYGIYEIYSKLFHHTTNKITDNVGNQCIRSIICIKSDDQLDNRTLYEYKTIAVSEEISASNVKKRIYFEPVERRPRMM